MTDAPNPLVLCSWPLTWRGDVLCSRSALVRLAGAVCQLSSLGHVILDFGALLSRLAKNRQNNSEARIPVGEHLGSFAVLAVSKRCGILEWKRMYRLAVICRPIIGPKVLLEIAEDSGNPIDRHCFSRCGLYSCSKPVLYFYIKSQGRVKNIKPQSASVFDHR